VYTPCILSGPANFCRRDICSATMGDVASVLYEAWFAIIILLASAMLAMRRECVGTIYAMLPDRFGSSILP
jgi:hypothetical protein